MCFDSKQIFFSHISVKKNRHMVFGFWYILLSLIKIFLFLILAIFPKGKYFILKQLRNKSTYKKKKLK